MWWKGWAVFGSILMMITGAFQLLAGIFGLFNSEFVVQGYDGYYLFDVSGLAVWLLVLGAVVLLGGVVALGGTTWGRIVGLVAAALAILSHLFMMPVNPTWSVIMIVVYVLVLLAFIFWQPPQEEEAKG